MVLISGGGSLVQKYLDNFMATKRVSRLRTSNTRHLSGQETRQRRVRSEEGDGEGGQQDEAHGWRRRQEERRVSLLGEHHS